MNFRSFALAALAAAVVPAQAAISVSSTSFTYSQSFDTLATTGTANPWVNDSTLVGWSLYNSLLAAPATYVADNGASNAGAFRSFGATGSTDRALGGVASGGTYFGSPPSGAAAGWIVVGFTNDTGSTITSFTLSYDGEQWRNGGNTSAQTMFVDWGFGATYTGATFSSSTLGFTSPVTGATAAAVNGNGAGLVAGAGGTVVTTWAPGETLWLRFNEFNDIGNDHGLGIDNFAFSVTAVPEPGTLAMLLAGIATVGFVARRRV